MDPKLETASSEIVQASAPVQQSVVEKPKKSKGLIATATIMTILALAGIGFGVYGMFFYEKPTCEINCSENNSEVDSESDDPENTNTAPTVSEVQQLLKTKYGFEEVRNTFGTGIASSIWERLDSFNDRLKIAYTIKSSEDILSEADWTQNPVIRYADYNALNERYKLLFGNDNDLPKNTEEYEIDSYAITKAVYVPESDSYEIYFANGLGGAPKDYILSKVIDVTGSEESFTATVASIVVDSRVEDRVVNTNPDNGNYFTTMSPEYLTETQESLTSHKLNFIKENGEYKLISIK